MSALRLLGFAAVLILSSAAHADGAVKLYCAANATGFFDAEMQLSGSGPNLVNVTFLRTRPSNTVIDWALRDCLKTAVKLDASRDIVGSAWFLPDGSTALQVLRKTLKRR